MRRLMLALSIASFIASPVALAQGRHSAAAKAHHPHTAQARAASHDRARSHRTARAERLENADRSHRLAYAPRNRHHESNQPRVADEEELAIPEQ
ncbi:MAG: hypothetical protein JSR26_05650 [Proteobacteria bacterium]|nr:hypothetical protein [Pseudomonadota bacterium]